MKVRHIQRGRRRHNSTVAVRRPRARREDGGTPRHRLSHNARGGEPQVQAPQDPEPASDVRLHQDEAHLPQDDIAEGQIRHHSYDI